MADKDSDQGAVDRGDELDPTAQGVDGAEAEGAGSLPPAKDDEVKSDKLGDDLETPEEKADREKEEAEVEAKKRIRIPKARFDEAQAKARAREQALLGEIEQLKGGQQATATQKAVLEMRGSIEELQDKYEDLILDGKKDDARKVRKQIDSMREELVDYQTSVKSDAARKSAVDELTYNAQLAGFEAKYPALNPDHDAFDEQKTTEVATLLSAFIKAGMRRADALTKAVKYALGAPAESKADDATKTQSEDRSKKARDKAAGANTRQPPSITALGLDTDKAGKTGESGVDVMRMSQDKFAKLDEETKARLRGDEL